MATYIYMQKILFSVFILITSIPGAFALGTGDRLDLAITPIRVNISAIA